MKNRFLSLFALGLLAAGAKAQTGNFGIGTATPGSTLTVNGSIAGNYTVVTANFHILTDTEYFVVYEGSASSDIHMPLPGPATKGRMYAIKNASSSTINVRPNDNEYIDGSNGPIALAPGQTITVVGTGLSGPRWRVVSFANANAGGPVAGAVTAASNGLTAGSGQVKLGGTLTEATGIDQSNHNLSFTGTGKFGIGTASPVSKLSIVSNGAGNQVDDDVELSSYNASPSATFFFKSSRGTEALPGDLRNGDELGKVLFAGRMNGSLSPASSVEAYYRGDGTNNQSDLNFSTSGAHRLRIAENGRVGIGTGSAAPETMLEVASDVTNWRSGLMLNNTHATQGRKFSISSRTDNTSGTGRNGVFSISDETAFSTRLTINQDGHVGIGAMNPSDRLTVESGNQTTATFITTNSDANGVVNIRVPVRNTNPDWHEFMYFYHGNDARGQIKLDGTGTGVLFSNVSDMRLKENITRTQYGLKDLLKIEVKDYNFKGSDPKTTRTTGFLAQDLYKIFPLAVSRGDDGATVSRQWSVDYGKLTPLLVKAVQEQQAQIEALKASLQQAQHNNQKLAAQAAELTELKAAVALMRSELQQVVKKKAPAGRHLATK